MSRLTANITHGDLNVRIRHGGGGGADLLGLAAFTVAAVVIGLLILEYIWWIIGAAVLAAAARLWFWRQAAADRAAITAAFAREHEARKAEAAQALAEQRAHELEVASRSAPVIYNVIDPAAIAAAVAGAQRQRVTIRGEVER